MKFRLAIVLLICFVSVEVSAQIDSAEVYRQLFEEDEQLEPIEEEEEEKEGIPIFISLQPALYFPYNGISNYYNGSVKEIYNDELYVIQRIWNNPNNERIIIDDINSTPGINISSEQYQAIRFSEESGESNFNVNMNYDIGYLIGFQAFFNLKPRFSILLGFNFVSLKTASQIFIQLPDNSSTAPNFLNYKMDVFGKEQRFIIDLGMNWILGKRDLKYYVEGGVNFLMAKANDNYFITRNEQSNEDHRWSLQRTTNNTAANTITSFTFGGFAGFGLFLKMNDNFAFQVGPQVAINSIEFPGRTGYFPNYLINIRIIYLSGNSKL